MGPLLCRWGALGVPWCLLSVQKGSVRCSTVSRLTPVLTPQQSLAGSGLCLRFRPSFAHSVESLTPSQGFLGSPDGGWDPTRWQEVLSLVSDGF